MSVGRPSEDTTQFGRPLLDRKTQDAGIGRRMPEKTRKATFNNVRGDPYTTSQQVDRDDAKPVEVGDYFADSVLPTIWR